MKTGIIGFGKMGMLHAALLNQMDDVKLVSIAEKTVYMRFGAKTLMPHLHYYKDYNQMFEQEPLDAVVVCTPTFLHMDIAKAAVQNGMDVFIEKPLSNRLDTALELRNLLVDKNRMCMVGYCLRYTPTFKKAKDIIESGVLGKLVNAAACAYIADVFSVEKGWRYNPALSGGGVVMDFTVHILDMLCWYLGKVSALSATTQKLYSLEVEDEASILLTFQNGCKVKVDTSWSKENARKSFFMIELTGSNGSMKVTDQTIVLRLNGKEPEEIYYPDLYKGYYVDIAGGFYSEQIVDFVKACKSRQKLENSIDSAIHVQAVVDAVYRSALTGSEVTVEVQNG